MIRGVVGKEFLLGCAPRGRTALVSVLETDYMINVNEVAELVSVETYRGGGFVAAIIEA